MEAPQLRPASTVPMLLPWDLTVASLSPTQTTTAYEKSAPTASSPRWQARVSTDTAATAGPGTQARISGPLGIAVALDGSLYIADTGNNRVRQVATDGTISTVAGTGTAGYSGDGGQGTNAQLYHPIRVAISPDGALYIADLVNHRVRKLRSDGLISTVAGNGVPGYSGDGGPATEAELNNPVGLAVGADDRLYIADSGNNRIRMVGVDGSIVTLAGNGTAGYGGETGPGAAASLNDPAGIAVGPDGMVYVADTFNSRLREVAYGLRLFARVNWRSPRKTVTLPTSLTCEANTNARLTSSRGPLLYQFLYDLERATHRHTRRRQQQHAHRP